MNVYEQLSEERKALQEQGLVPDWYTTAGYQMFKDKYEYEVEGRSVRGQFERIAATAASHLRKFGGEEIANEKFFELLWKGWLSPSTPVLANTGTNRGLPVSCSGGYIDDSIYGFYEHRLEVAMLTKNGFGTSGYLGGIRQRGSKISVGGKASGVSPVFQSEIRDMRDVAQGTARRGAYAGYLEADHGDFDEVCDFIYNNPDDANIGWIITDAFIELLEEGDADTHRRFKKMLKLKMVHGKGYFFFVDKANRHRPEMYVQHDLFINNSNLCSEIMLFNDKDHTFTCVLSSMNVAKYDEWKDTDAVYWATWFLDCIAEEFIQRAKLIPGLEKAVRFTEKGRALGLGQCGFHTYLQQNMIAFESFEAHMKNSEIAKHIWDESLRASQMMASALGEPEWCKGHGVRNTHRIAIAPTKSTANLMGGVSEGINPDPAYVYTASGAAGEMDRINPILLAIMKARGVYNKKVIADIADKQGSVQHVTWLSEDEKKVFKTAFEIDMRAVIRLASTRGRWIDQWQSVNLFFAAEEDEAYIAEIHQEAFLDPNMLALYYIYTQAGVQAAKGECEACQ
jgi:ribonucleoside-diphosphate reductase alpha chain